MAADDKVVKLLKPELRKRGFSDEILVCSRCDMDLDCNPMFGIVALCKDAVYFAVCPPPSRELYDLAALPKEIEELYRYPLAETESLESLPLAAGGMLILTKDGKEQALCAYSSAHTFSIMRLTRLFQKVKSGGELSPGDLEDEQGVEYCPKCGAPYPERGRQVCPRCMDKRSVLKRLLVCFKPFKAQVAIVFLCIFLTAGFNVLLPYFNGIVLYDSVLQKQDAGVAASPWIALLLVVLTMAGIHILQQLFGVFQGRVTAKVVPQVVLNIKTQVYAALQKLSVSFFSKRQTGGLMARVNNDANEVFSFFLDSVPYFAVNVVMTVTAVTIMFSLSWKLAIASIVLIPFLVIVCVKLLPRLWHMHGKLHRGTRNLNANINDNITGARVVRAFGQGEHEIQRFQKLSARVRSAEISQVDYSNIFFSSYSAVQVLSTLLVNLVGFCMILLTEEASYGMLVTFLGYQNLLAGPIQFFTEVFQRWANSANAAQRIFEIIDAVPEVRESDHPVRHERFEGRVEFKNVNFYYEPNKQILKDVSFVAEPGKMLGIVGHTGTGKTTIVSLMSRLYDVTGGEVLIDGINVKDMAFSDLRKNIAMVSQETYIFRGTVAENIAYANPGCTREQIMAAAITANAHDFICKMPDGYDTVIGSGSRRQLSGGERQRLSIARAILADPRILILDEATAAVDTQTEKNIQAALDKLAGGRTVISIAHRLSTLRGADRLIVIEDGRVVESGGHEELLKQKGVYYRLTQLQNKALAMRGLE